MYFVLSTLGISLMVNAPGLFYGYGPVFAAMVYAAWAFTPATAVALFGLAHAAALGILLPSKSIFPIVAIISLLLRTPFIYPAARIRQSKGLFASGLFLYAADIVIALTIALLYYGENGIHVSLAVYEAFLLPFIYLIYQYSREEGVNGILGTAASITALGAYIFSIFAFLSPLALAMSLLSLLILYLQHGFLQAQPPSTVLAVLVISLLLPLAGLALGGTGVYYNAKTALYPFMPSSWSEDRWKQWNTTACPPQQNVFQNTYDPERLRIIDTCRVVEGTVVGAPFISGDGDYCFDLKVDPQYADMLGIGNIVLRKGTLHIEIVPADHEKILLKELRGGVCPGDRVRVKGVFVVDTDHGLWTEIHPVVEIKVLKRASDKPWPLCVIGRTEWAEAGE